MYKSKWGLKTIKRKGRKMEPEKGETMKHEKGESKAFEAKEKDRKRRNAPSANKSSVRYDARPKQGKVVSPVMKLRNAMKKLNG